MKKILLLSFTYLVLSFAIISVSFFNASQTNYYNLFFSGENIGNDVIVHDIVFGQTSGDPEKIYEDLLTVLQKYHGNIYTTGYSQEHNITTKYILCTNPNLFRNLILESGHFFNADDNRSLSFLSTKMTKEADQIGHISPFREDFEIRTLYSGLGDGIFERQFTVVLPQGNLFQSFRNELLSRGYDITDTTSISLRLGLDSQKRYYGILKWLAIAIATIIMIIIAFFGIVNSYKKIGVKKLLGYSIKTIWLEQVPVIIISEIVISCITMLVCYFFLFNQWSYLIRSFFRELFLLHLLIICITSISISIPYSFIIKVKIAEVLKNKRSNKFALFFNTGLTILISSILICLSYGMFDQMLFIESRYKESYSLWETTISYAVISNAVVSTERYDPWSLEHRDGFRLAYMDFNDHGAIYADFELFKSETLNSYPNIYRAALVNPNYLEKHHAYDLNGDIIEIKEEESDLILLVPENYLAYEHEILQLYEKNTQPGQNVQIVWMDNQQSFFSYRLDVEPDCGNVVKDPIIIVLTEQNMDYWYGNIASSVLFVPVDDISNANLVINQTMSKYFDASQVTFPAYSVYSLVETQIRSAQQKIAVYAALLVILVVILGYVIFQNVLNYFELYKKRLAIQHFLGFRFFSKYKGIAFILLLSWVLAYCISLLLFHDWHTIVFVALLGVFQISITIAFIIRNEHRNILRIIKGE